MSLLLLFSGAGTAPTPTTDEDYYRRYLNDVETRDIIVPIGLPSAPSQEVFSAYLMETGSLIAYMLEDGSGAYLLEDDLEQDYFRRHLNDTLFRD